MVEIQWWVQELPGGGGRTGKRRARAYNGSVHGGGAVG